MLKTLWIDHVNAHKNMTENTMLKEIESAFSLLEMPLPTEVLFSNKNLEHALLIGDIEEFRNKPITGEFIRLIHREMSHLSPKFWRWILPHYLKYCLTAEAKYNRMETEFLIYSLAPALEFETDTTRRLSLLSRSQIMCLIHFLEWCLIDRYWQDFCPEELRKAIDFLHTIDSK